MFYLQSMIEDTRKVKETPVGMLQENKRFLPSLKN